MICNTNTTITVIFESISIDKNETACFDYITYLFINKWIFKKAVIDIALHMLKSSVSKNEVKIT